MTKVEISGAGKGLTYNDTPLALSNATSYYLYHV